MGNEFGQTNEWDYRSELDWELLQYEPHNKLQECVRTLNHIYRNNPAMYEYQFDRKGFEWVALDHRNEGIIVYKRKGKNRADDMVIVLNVTKTNYPEWKLELKGKTNWNEVFNSNDFAFWGNGELVNTEKTITAVDKKKKIYEIKLAVPALSAIILQ